MSVLSKFVNTWSHFMLWYFQLTMIQDCSQYSSCISLSGLSFFCFASCFKPTYRILDCSYRNLFGTGSVCVTSHLSRQNKGITTNTTVSCSTAHKMHYLL
jgi:hypothetical protein